MNLLGGMYIGMHGDILGIYIIPPPKGQVASSNLAWDTIFINEL